MLRVLAILFGIVLMLPGLCALGSIVVFARDLEHMGPDAVMILALWFVCFAISFGGVMLIRRGGRRTATPPPPES